MKAYANQYFVQTHILLYMSANVYGILHMQTYLFLLQTIFPSCFPFFQARFHFTMNMLVIQIRNVLFN